LDNSFEHTSSSISLRIELKTFMSLN
jgi:hypothetical protein